MPPRHSIETFVEKSNNVHSNKYDYSLVVYNGTHEKVNIICPIHGSFFQVPLSHMKGIGCKLCGLEQKKQTNLERYGVDNPRKSNLIKDKIKQTNLERHGVDNPRKSNIIKEKIKQTNLERYGVDNPRKSNLIKDKIKQTNLERHGVDNPSKSLIIQQYKINI